MSDFDDFTPPPKGSSGSPIDVTGAGAGDSGSLPVGTRQVPPEVQAARDRGRQAIIASEAASATDPQEKALREKELANNGGKPAASTASSGGADFGDFTPTKSLGTQVVEGAKALWDKGVTRYGEVTKEREGMATSLWNRMLTADDSMLPQELQAVQPKNLAKLGREGLAATEMVMSIPGMIAGVIGDATGRITALAEGASVEQSRELGRDISGRANELNREGIDLVKKLTGLSTINTADTFTNIAMERVTGYIGKTGETAAKQTSGVVAAEDVQSLADGLMAWAGARGISGPRPDALVKKIAQKTEEGSPTPVADAVQDMTFGMKMPEGTRAVILDAAKEMETKAAEAVPAEGRPGGMPAAVPVPLERIAEIKAKPGFLRTPEDRIAERAWEEQEAAEPGYGKALEAAATPGFLRTPEQNLYLAKYGKVALAATVGLAAWEAMDQDDREHATAAVTLAMGMTLLPEFSRHRESLARLSAMPDTAPLSSVLNNSTYTVKTFQRLPQNSFEFSKAHVEQELRRQDVTEAERESVQAALDAHPGDTIKAKDLVLGFRVVTKDFELGRKTTGKYAEYGLENIGRDSADHYQFHLAGIREARIERDQMREGEYNILDPDGELLDRIQLNGRTSLQALSEWRDNARKALEGAEASTNLYRLPIEVGGRNHFNDPNLFGWTRSFNEEGVKHVVEIQSDLAQHTKTLRAEERARVEDKLVEEQQTLNEIREEQPRSERGTEDLHQQLRERQQRLSRQALVVAELQAKLEASAESGKLTPVLKNWPKRLVREELDASARELENHRAQLEGAVRRAREDVERGAGDQIAREQLERSVKSLKELNEAPPVVRFATADTVAKVEGWPNRRAELTRSLEASKAYLERTRNGSERLSEVIPTLEAEVARKQASIDELKGDFSPEHQSIYDRYRRDIEKFLKQQGGKEVTDSHGHTWIEVPIPKKGTMGPTQMFGRADPGMLQVLAAGMVGAILGYEASDSKGGGLIGAILGLSIAKRAPGLIATLKASPEIRAAVVELRDRLYALGKQNEARGLDMLRYLKKDLPKDWAEHSKEIYEHLDSKGAVGLSERGKELFERYLKPIQNGNKAMIEALQSLGVKAADVIEDYGFHRVREGARPSLADTLSRGAYPFQRGLSTRSPSTIDRTVHQYTTATGELVIGVKDKAGGNVSLYSGGDLVGKGKLNAKTGELTWGEKVLRQSEASIADIEKNTAIRYVKEPLLTELDSSFRLGQALNNAYFLKTLEDLPGATDFMMKVEEGKMPPEGWRKPTDPSLGKYYFEPRLYEAVQDFTGDNSLTPAGRLGKINRMVVGTLFWNPLPHIMNVLDHAVVEKGVVGLATSLPTQIRSGVKAYREVSNLGPAYLAYLREGAGLMYPDVLLGDFSKQVLDAVGKRPEAGRVSQAFGYANPMEMVKRLYESSRSALWRWNDIIMMQAYMAREAGGLTKEAALKEVERHVPNYRVPERVMGSRLLSQLLTSPAFTTFGRYDYNRLASYGAMAKDILGKDASIADRAKALDQVAMLGMMSMVVYPMLLDTFAQGLTGNKNAEWTRFGASTIPTLLSKVWNGEELGSTALGKMFHISPIIELAPEIAMNRDLFSGERLFHTPGQLVEKVASKVAPIDSVQRIEGGKQSVEQVFWSALGIKSPTDAQVAKRAQFLHKDQVANEKARLKRAGH